ncbi:tripartite tricarboxylate transporter substrate-binding protein [Dankookia sp. P2]|uniref:tripartite tricarboxylate transporter substrate-binding protein n=1 Tax=Dankookia sp. P2 TaxID=3423955 RepID=UPI003D6704E8
MNLTLLTAIFRAAQVLAVAKSVPARSVTELVSLSEKRPVAYGTVGRGGPGHILMEMLAGETGGRFENAVYRTEATVVQDMIGGAIPGFMGSLMLALSQHPAGGIRILALTTPRRIAARPEVPCFAELGLSALTFLYCHGLAVPAGTRRPVVERLHSAVAMLSEAVRSRMTPDVTSPAEFTASIQRETAALTKMIEERGITAG